MTISETRLRLRVQRLNVSQIRSKTLALTRLQSPLFLSANYPPLLQTHSGVLVDCSAHLPVFPLQEVYPSPGLSARDRTMSTGPKSVGRWWKDWKERKKEVGPTHSPYL